MRNFLKLFVLAALCCSSVLQAAGSLQRGTEIRRRIESVKSITYYKGEWSWADFDLADFKDTLAQMRQTGANTVWLVLPWIDFQPQALPEPLWNEEAVKNLTAAVTAADDCGMDVILPLCYLGTGWSPEGIDPCIWTVDASMYGAFKSYSRELVGKLIRSGNDNMIFLLYGEGCYPYISSLRDYDVTVESFKAWCRKNNSSIDYWNKRWGTEYSWDNLLPFKGGTSDPRDANAWTDYWRWSSDVVRAAHGGLARELRGVIKGKAIIGYHDDAIISKDWGLGATPIPEDNPYQFLSFAHYYTEQEFGSLDKFISETNTIISTFRQAYPQMPLGIFETGLCVHQSDIDSQAKVVEEMAGIANKKNVGINIWMWQDHETGDDCQRTFGLLYPDGREKPAYTVLKKAWK
ncbi:hypothetical protein SMSP2_02710 [Limihaloglobus sulfuriphilus]|uniref:Endo-beta-mannanase n=1 Tax=Limihaloglobus sulfuriphilus TaxID=1851148 RepID=A0A1Q2MIY4_9BACT|nr:hypothetical protein [Limihaloglobus sulfuriphilus]AQQ72327.1 hypothetical protein SMSP2_02710 [Limihaloglobus sulfuriphilus]